MTHATPNAPLRLPPELRRSLGKAQQVHPLQRLLRANNLHTVCEEARCPNRAECFSHGTATFMIGGDRCTRSCRFCSVTTARPLALDPGEPQHVAGAVVTLGLQHVVITSVDRDDLPDGGAAHWAATITAVKQAAPEATVEVLTPDFKGNRAHLDLVLAAGPHVFSHNTETVPRLYRALRPQSHFETTFNVLRNARGYGGKLKSGIMVGLGETDTEVMELMERWASLPLDIATVGQYLRPSMDHWEVARYVEPPAFEAFKARGEALGIGVVFSGAMVRSSYHAGETFLELGARPVARSNPLAVLP
jgi:lipoic acid synthetase